MKAGAMQLAGARGGTAAQMAKQFAAFHEKGLKIQTGPKGKKVAITRELAVKKIRKRFEGQFTKAETDKLLASVNTLLDRIPTEEQIRKRPIVVKSILNGREVGRGTNTAEQEAGERGAGIFTVPGRGPKPRRAAKK
jgi:hypothetical protein